MKEIEEIRAATLRLRSESGCDEWGTRVKAGKIQLVRVTYRDNGTSFVWPVSYWMPIPQMAGFINQIPR